MTEPVTPEETEILAMVARRMGWRRVEAHVTLILDQARALADLPERP